MWGTITKIGTGVCPIPLARLQRSFAIAGLSAAIEHPHDWKITGRPALKSTRLARPRAKEKKIVTVSKRGKVVKNANADAVARISPSPHPKILR